MSATTEYVSDDGAITLLVTNAVIDDWQFLKQDKKEKAEAFGVLIGGQNHDASQFWIKACTTPLAKDKSTRTSFYLKDTRHQKFVDKHFKESNGTSGYLGTWHSHPEPIPIPSHIDLKDWHSCCARNPDRKLIFVIVGISHFCMYHRTGKYFERICKESL